MLSFTFGMIFWGQLIDHRAVVQIIFTGCGGVSGAILAWSFERLFTAQTRLTSRFAAIFFFLTLSTGSMTSIISAFYNLPFFHPQMYPINTPEGWRDIIIFIAANTYSFAANTARLFLPMGLVCLFLGSFLYCIMNIKNQDTD